MKLELISRYPDNAPGHVPLLFVHDAWHGAWCWTEHFLPYFAGYGFEAHALSLRGHGASQGQARLRWHSISDYVADVAQIAGRFERAPVLIGHGLGGYIVQKYLERYSAAGAILLAPLPVRGCLGALGRCARRRPAIFFSSLLYLSPYLLIGASRRVRKAFFSANMPDGAVERYFGLLQEESFRIGLDAALLNRPRPARAATIPLLVIGAANDAIFTPAEVEQTAVAYNTTAEILADIAHDLMLEENWREVADRMGAWLFATPFGPTKEDSPALSRLQRGF